MLSKEQKLNIIREYRSKINEPLMSLGRWQDFLEGDYWKKDFSDGSGSGFCLVCGKKISGRYVGSHFQQTGGFQKEHSVAVRRYDDALKTVFVHILKDHGLKLKDDAKTAFHGIWWGARLDFGCALHYWDEEIEAI